MIGRPSGSLNNCMSLTITELLLVEEGFEDHRFYDLSPPPPGSPDLPAWLQEWFSNEANYGGASPDDGESVLASGRSWFSCDSWAHMVKDALPDRTKVWGFWVDDNPDAHEIAKMCDGHTFAVVDGRYIVDGWAENVEGVAKKSVFDLKDPQDQKMIVALYGKPENWHEMP